jgi:hypothetical protein
MQEGRKPTNHDITHFSRIEYLKYRFKDRHEAILADANKDSSR